MRPGRARPGDLGSSAEYDGLVRASMRPGRARPEIQEVPSSIRAAEALQ